MSRPEPTPRHSPGPGTWTRRRVLGLLGGATALASLPALAEESTPESTPSIVSNQPGEMPSMGALRPGPVGQEPPTAASATTIPVGIQVEAAGIDADIEALDIENGKLTDPTGPWVVSWYRQSAELGEPGNILMAGHVDYWGVGPSVFYNVRDLAEGDDIAVIGENGETYLYQVAWNETFLLEDLVSGTMAEVVASTGAQVLTLFTCGGEFDYVNGEYLSRTIVRAERVLPEPGAATPPA
jgi:hypothetical protein